MPLEVRPIAVSCAVLCFFGISITGALCGVSMETCSHRGFLGAVITYIAVSILVKAVNAILTQAVVENYVLKNEELTDNGSR